MAYDRQRIIASAKTYLKMNLTSDHLGEARLGLWNRFVDEATVDEPSEIAVIHRVVNLAERYLCLPVTRWHLKTASGTLEAAKAAYDALPSKPGLPWVMTRPPTPPTSTTITIPPTPTPPTPRRPTGRKFKP